MSFFMNVFFLILSHLPPSMPTFYDSIPDHVIVSYVPPDAPLPTAQILNTPNGPYFSWMVMMHFYIEI